MDKETARLLVLNPFKIYFDSEKNGKSIESEILENDELLKELGDMWTQHQGAIETLIKVINANLVKHMVQSALPVEIVGLRHELQGAEKIMLYLKKYAEESKRREKSTTQQDEDNTSPPEEESVKPEETEEESSL